VDQVRKDARLLSVASSHLEYKEPYIIRVKGHYSKAESGKIIESTKEFTDVQIPCNELVNSYVTCKSEPLTGLPPINWTSIAQSWSVFSLGFVFGFESAL